MTPKPSGDLPDDDQKMVEIELGRIVLRDQAHTEAQYILLREVDGERSFPIIIGFPEATEIQRVVTGLRTERPMTHELLSKAIEALGAHISSVEIVDVRQNTFYAQLVLEGPSGEPLGILDARPSDSIALALRAKCPILVSESVLEQTRTDRGKDTLEGDPPPPPNPEPPPDLPGF